jgi:penicillin-binding protein 1B
LAVRFHIPRSAFLARLLLYPVGRFVLAASAALLILALLALTFAWIHFSRIVDQKLAAGPFTQTSLVLAAPENIAVGDPLSSAELIQWLRRRGYNENHANRIGWFNVRSDGVEIFPGPDSYGGEEPGVIRIQNDRVTKIISSRDHTERQIYSLEPELITNLFDRKRQKRRLVGYADLPPVLVQAIVSVEDKRFFQHSGFDPLRIVRAVVKDVKEGRKAEGASTLSMQLARGFWLTQEKTWTRKLSEAVITIQIEQKLSKEQIFEYYANNVDLGQRRSFAIHGVGEGAQVYFGKDVRELTLEEAALLAGLIQRPNFLNPYRHADRAIARRNVVLSLMRDNGYISEEAMQLALQSPLVLAQGGIESTDAPYFVDLVYDELQEQVANHDFQSSSYRIYTTLDLKLQRDAVEAVQVGMKEVDQLLAKRKKKYPEAQVALVALDSRTGEIRALVGGRNYGASQLNRALARRQPGSVFKPFVYAAALGSVLEKPDRALTSTTKVADEPTTFEFDGQIYEPGNFGEKYYGEVTMRFALAKSLNVPTVKFAEMAGYSEVVRLARAAGMSSSIRPTPAVALGAYEATPLEIAGAYTTFVNGGTWIKPVFIQQVRSQAGTMIYEAQRQRKEVLDPRVNYVLVNLMEDVLKYGTGAGARGRGFTLPAAGKTGTSHDAWFAGFTSRLLCVVWVGFDDNRELPLEGGKAALPIWVEFMKRAHRYREYRAVTPFEPPEGVVTVDVDSSSGLLATAGCPAAHTEVFLSGTEPARTCDGGSPERSQTMIAGFESPAEVLPPGVPATSADASSRRRSASSPPGSRTTPLPAETRAKEKPSILERFRAIFR